MLTNLLVAAASVLGTLAAVLVILIIKTLRARSTALDTSAPPAAAGGHSDSDALARDLQAVVATYRETPGEQAAPPPPMSAAAADTPPAAPRAEELDELLARTLETARAVPGADGALIAVTPADDPVIATLGLSRDEADRLAATLPTGSIKTRSVAIGYEYQDEPWRSIRGARIERGIAVPVPRVSVPALVAVLTRDAAAEFGELQLALLEEVARQLAPELSAALQARATAARTDISVWELDRGGLRATVRSSGEGEERQEGGQIDWLRRG
jgi:hypothetical protein